MGGRRRRKQEQGERWKRKEKGKRKGKRKRGAKVEAIADAVMVKGNTFPLRHDLKELGFKWDAEDHEWWREAKGASESSVRWLRSFSRVEVEFGPKVVVSRREAERGGKPRPPPPPRLRWGEAVDELRRRIGPDEVEALKWLLRHGDASFQLLERGAADRGAVRVRFGQYVLTRYRTGKAVLGGRGVPRGTPWITLIEGVDRIIGGPPARAARQGGEA